METIESCHTKMSPVTIAALSVGRRYGEFLWCDSLTNSVWQDPGSHKDLTVPHAKDQSRVCVCLCVHVRVVRLIWQSERVPLYHCRSSTPGSFCDIHAGDELWIHLVASDMQKKFDHHKKRWPFKVCMKGCQTVSCQGSMVSSGGKFKDLLQKMY